MTAAPIALESVRVTRKVLRNEVKTMLKLKLKNLGNDSCIIALDVPEEFVRGLASMTESSKLTFDASCCVYDETRHLLQLSIDRYGEE